VARRERPSAPHRSPYGIMAIGASWGGVAALSVLVRTLPSNWPLPIVIVQHQHAHSGSALERILSRLTSLKVVDAEDKLKLERGLICIAPANYHLLAEGDGTVSLSVEAPVNYSRPSIDVTFTSLAEEYGRRCIGVLLTGANEDGVEGLRQIRGQGGLTIAQCPDEAEAPVMPEAAIAAGVVDTVLSLKEIVPYITRMMHDGNK